MSDVLRPQSVSASDAGERQREPDPASRLLSIGRALNERTALLARAVHELKRIVDRETGDLLLKSAAECAGVACSIAVVGQMNAGKSSLINALVEEGDLLPSDVNPWTTVLTKLHFGVEGLPRSGASFQMFTSDEWRRLAAGGRTKEIVDGLIEDFDWERLQAQVEEMTLRARRKLGGRLDGLLGSVHAYPALTPGLLARYVAAGGHGADKNPSNAGEFADITKVANVYMGLGAFTYPAIVVDTPGVNDPFLVRDEITRQSLEQTDICIVVVTARDPLSEADLTLLRTLHRLGRSRVIIFVNKIDEVEPAPGLKDRLLGRMTPILDRAFPGIRIPVIFGSVIWGKQALAAQAHIAASNAAPLDLAYGDPENAAVTLGALLRGSGLPDLAVTISTFMQDGPIAARLEAEADYIETLIANALSAFEFEAAILTEFARDRDAAWNSMQAFESRWKLPGVLLDLEARFFGVIANRLPKLDSDLRNVVTQIVGKIPLSKSPEWLAWWRQMELQTRLALERKAASSVSEAFQALIEEEREVIQSLKLDDRKRCPQTGSTVASQMPIFHLPDPITPGTIEAGGGADIDQTQAEVLAEAAFKPVVEAMMQHYASELMAHSNKRMERLKLAAVRPFELAMNGLREIEAELANEAKIQDALTDREAKANELRDILQMMTRFKQGRAEAR